MTKERNFYLVFAALLVLTVTTVALSYVNLGPLHIAAGMSIAIAKAMLIAVFFMHVLKAPRLIWIVGLSGVFWLGILMFLTLSDYLTR